jgi:hypothetical protein
MTEIAMGYEKRVTELLNERGAKQLLHRLCMSQKFADAYYELPQYYKDALNKGVAPKKVRDADRAEGHYGRHGHEATARNIEKLAGERGRR